MKILVDAMGGDNAPKAIVDGCIDALNEKEGFSLKLYGEENQIISFLIDKKYPEDRLSIVNTTQVIDGHDIPTKAIKEKKDSSLVVALKELRHSKGDVFVSAGNTGAVMAGALFGLGRIKGVLRPALTSMIPTKRDLKILLDVGANAICKPKNYLDFAIMGTIYMKQLFGIENPTVGLLNIGSENTKGNDSIKAAYELLKSSDVNFIGNIEGKDILTGDVDVIVTDGFNGNILLKFLEGVGDFVFSELKKVFMSSIITKLSSIVLKGNLKKFKSKLDYSEYGGVPLLGVNGKVLKAHGGSDSKAIKNLILSGYRYGKSSVLEEISHEFKKMEVVNIGK